MTESFAQLFEQSLANQRIRPGMILMGPDKQPIQYFSLTKDAVLIGRLLHAAVP